MSNKAGLKALLRPEDSIRALTDHQPYRRFTNLNRHEPTMGRSKASDYSPVYQTRRTTYDH